MVQNHSCEANISWGTHEKSRILWNPPVHYNIHNSLSVDSISRQTNPVHALPAYVLKLNYYDTIIILPCTVSLTSLSSLHDSPLTLRIHFSSPLLRNQVKNTFQRRFLLRVIYPTNQTASVVLWLACWPLAPKFAGSNPAEAVGFFGRKNPQHAFLRRGSKRICPMSQLCGM